MPARSPAWISSPSSAMKLRSRVIRQTGRLLEVCDPVENYTYSTDGVSVDDFALPSGLVGIRRPR